MGQRPGRPFLTAVWRHLVMLNYRVEPDLLRPHLPPGTELDTWQGAHYLSLVGFRFLRTRVLGVAVPMHRDFEEVNLRFYVRRRAAEGWRRGVVFLSEIVPRRAVAAVARLLYGEPYRAMPMRHELSLPDGKLEAGASLAYRWRHRGRWHALRATAAAAPAPPGAGTEEEFIAEHYWGYTARRRGGAAEYRVEHAPWRVAPAAGAALDCDVEAVYGRRFTAPLGGPPHSALIAEGSPVAVHSGHRW
jgi:uncharacterized protein